MNTVELAKLLMQKMDWNQADLAQKIGISRQATQRVINEPIKTDRRGSFHLGVISLALRSGFEAEALSVLLESDNKQIVSTALRAAILYPDIKPDELEKLLQAEKLTNLSSLPVEIIKSMISKSRS